MNVRPHRRRAARPIALTLLVALSVAVPAAAPGTALAKDPPGLGRFMHAIGKVESGGNYRARNKASGAYGKYQIMPSNWPAWAKRYLGSAKANPTPANQEKVARGKFTSLYASVHSWRRVAYWWLTGDGRTSGWSTRATTYVTKVMRSYGSASSKIPRAPGTPSQPVASTAHVRLSERSAQVRFGGSWRTARHGAYAGDAVRYATARGASATVTFSGRSIAWYGPVGPTRGKARVLIDGKVVRVVDLHRSSFTAHKLVYSGRLAKAGTHTLTIEVIGTRGHAMVAVDEFVVGR